jgi:hypothetical protein
MNEDHILWLLAVFPLPPGPPATQPYQVLKDKGEGLLCVDHVM